MPIQAILFDVGNTLLFPDYEKTLAPLFVRNVHPTQAQLQSSERVARQETDLMVSRTRKVDQQYWEVYYSHLLHQLGLSDVSLRLELVSLARTSSNWSRMNPGTLEILGELKQKYRLAAISNSDGHMAERLASFGFTNYFEQVIDSGNVGFEKPAPQIFQAALKAMSVVAEESVYVGDIYSVDYLGAQNAGMHAILMDVAGVYATRNVLRIESLQELETAISALSTSP